MPPRLLQGSGQRVLDGPIASIRILELVKVHLQLTVRYHITLSNIEKMWYCTYPVVNHFMHSFVDSPEAHDFLILLHARSDGDQKTKKMSEPNSKRLLVLNSFEEERVLRRLKSNALSKCDPLIKQFSDCATGRALSMPFACRKANRAMQDCVSAVLYEIHISKIRIVYDGRGKG